LELEVYRLVRHFVRLSIHDDIRTS